jgi:hypothetical protein
MYPTTLSHPAGATHGEPHGSEMILNSWKLGSRFTMLVVLFGTAIDGGYAWAADVPPYFERLIEAGNVEFEFYDPEKTPREHLGHAQFKLHVRHRSSFQFGWTIGRGVRHLTIRATISDISPRLTHTITLPKWLDSDRRWRSQLVKHEFDHVAISCGPRVMMLVERLYDGVDTIDQSVPSGTRIDNRFVEKLVNEQISSRLKAVIDVMQANQNLLDEVTRHGIRPIAEGKKFFGSLYTEPNLKEIGFPYLGEVGDILRSKAYREAELPYQVD